MKTKNTIKIVETPIIDPDDFHVHNGIINPAFSGTGSTHTNDHNNTDYHYQNLQVVNPYHHQHAYSLNRPSHHPRPPPQPQSGYSHSLRHNGFRPQTGGQQKTPTVEGDYYYRSPYHQTLPVNGSSIASSWVYEFNNGSAGSSSTTDSQSTNTTGTGSRGQTPETISMSGTNGGQSGQQQPLPSIHRGSLNPHRYNDYNVNMDLSHDHKLNGGLNGQVVGPNHHSGGQCCRTMLRLFVWALILLSLLGIALSVAFIIYIEKFSHPSAQCCDNKANKTSPSGVVNGVLFNKNQTPLPVITTTITTTQPTTSGVRFISNGDKMKTTGGYLSTAIVNRTSTMTTPTIPTVPSAKTIVSHRNVSSTAGAFEPRFSVLNITDSPINDTTNTATNITSIVDDITKSIDITAATDVYTTNTKIPVTTSTATNTVPVSTVTSTTALPIETSNTSNHDLDQLLTETSQLHTNLDTTKSDTPVTTTGTLPATITTKLVETTTATTTNTIPSTIPTTITKLPASTTPTTKISNVTAPNPIPIASPSPVPDAITTGPITSQPLTTKTSTDYSDYYNTDDYNTPTGAGTTTERNYAQDQGAALEDSFFNAFN